MNPFDKGPQPPTTEQKPDQQEQENLPDGKIIEYANHWEVYEAVQAKELQDQLDTALREGNNYDIEDLLAKQPAVRTLIVNRGKGRQILESLESGLISLLKELHGPNIESVTDISPEKLLKLIESSKLDFLLLIELTSLAYHLDDGAMFDYGLEAGKLLDNQVILASQMHNDASWLHAKEKNPQEAAILNKNVIGLARTLQDRVLELKAQVGLLLQQPPRQDKQAEQLSTTAQEMFAIQHMPDAIRTQEEAAKVHLEIAQYHLGRKDRTELENKNEAEKELKRAKSLALDSFKKARKLGYKVAELRAARVMGNAFLLQYSITNNSKHKENGEDFKNKAEKLEQEFEYTTSY